MSKREKILIALIAILASTTALSLAGIIGPGAETIYIERKIGGGRESPRYIGGFEVLDIVEIYQISARLTVGESCHEIIYWYVDKYGRPIYDYKPYAPRDLEVLPDLDILRLKLGLGPEFESEADKLRDPYTPNDYEL